MCICIRCGNDHPESYFNRDRQRPSGRYPYCKDCSRRACRAIFAKNHELHLELKRRWKAENRSKPEQREKERAYTRAWRLANLERAKDQNRQRKAVIKRATPPWVDMAAIKAVYAARPNGQHVDHIEPLRGADRSGLHVPWNLQYLSAAESLRKYNKTQVSLV